jgi:hypothetical protein
VGRAGDCGGDFYLLSLRLRDRQPLLGLISFTPGGSFFMVDFVGLRDVWRIALRQTILIMPYFMFVVFCVLYGEGRAWITRIKINHRINHTAFHELERERIVKLQKLNERLNSALKSSNRKVRILERRLQTAFLGTDWGQEIIKKILVEGNGEKKAAKKTG